MAMIQFVKNYEDLSTDKGFQFKFYCDKCGNGFMSRFHPSGGRCEECAPDYQEELASAHAHAKAEATREQLYETAQQTDYVSGIDMSAGSVAQAPSRPQPQSAAKASATCSSCGADVGRAKFCPECGTPTKPAPLTCNGCGFQPENPTKFCPECGAKMPLIG